METNNQSSLSLSGVKIALIGAASYMIAQIVFWVYPVLRAIMLYLSAESSNNLIDTVEDAVATGKDIISICKLSFFVIIIGMAVYAVGLHIWKNANEHLNIKSEIGSARNAIILKFTSLVLPIIYFMLTFESMTSRVASQAISLDGSGLQHSVESAVMIMGFFIILWFVLSLYSYLKLKSTFKNIAQNSQLKSGAERLSTAGKLGVWLRISVFIFLLVVFFLGHIAESDDDMLNVAAMIYIIYCLFLLALMILGTYNVIKGWNVIIDGTNLATINSVNEVYAEETPKAEVVVNKPKAIIEPNEDITVTEPQTVSVAEPQTIKQDEPLVESSAKPQTKSDSKWLTHIALPVLVLLIAAGGAAFFLLNKDSEESTSSKSNTESSNADSDADAEYEEYIEEDPGCDNNAIMCADALYALELCVNELVEMTSWDQERIDSIQAAANQAINEVPWDYFDEYQQEQLQQLYQRGAAEIERLQQTRINTVEQIGIIEPEEEELLMEDYNAPNEEEVAEAAKYMMENSDDDTIHEVVEENAQFPGGDDACTQWLASHLQYPESAEEQGIQGRVITSFVVNTDGSIVDIKVLRSPDPSLAKEAVRVVKSMPKWKPARQDNKVVRSRFNLPINFRLQ